MPRVTTVKKASKDYPEYGIKKGDQYFWWKFRYGGKRMSKTYPKRSQLTQSDYLGQLYDIQDQLSELSADTPEDLQSVVDEIKDNLENLKSETEDKLSNMPDQLQYSPTGELLQERIDALDNAISELEGIDLDYEEPYEDELKEAVADETDIDSNEDGWEEKIDASLVDEKKEEKLREWLDEKIEELQSVSFE